MNKSLYISSHIFLLADRISSRILPFFRILYEQFAILNIYQGFCVCVCKIRIYI